MNANREGVEQSRRRPLAAEPSELDRHVRPTTVLGLALIIGALLFGAWYLGFRQGSGPGNSGARSAGAPVTLASQLPDDADAASSSSEPEAVAPKPDLELAAAAEQLAVDRHDPKRFVVLRALPLHEEPRLSSPVTHVVIVDTEVIMTERRERWLRLKVVEGGLVSGWFMLPGEAKETARTARAVGTTTIRGTVFFKGTPPAMSVPRARAEAEYCRDGPVSLNAVMVSQGRLADVYVGLANGQIDAAYESEEPAVVRQETCVYTPRIQGVLTEQEIHVVNADPTLHNVNASLANTTLFNTAQPKGAPDLEKAFETVGVYTLKCDVHPWMRAFIVASDHPFFSISVADGGFEVTDVPAGKFKLVTWHSQFGRKEMEVETKDGDVLKADFTYLSTDEPPFENPDELDAR